MGILSRISQLENKFAIGMTGLILTLFFGLFAVYIEYFKERRPQVSITVLNNSSVLDVREEVNNLEIFYDNIDIKKDKKTLRVLVVRISNSGLTDILKSHYDDNTPIGLKIPGASIVKAELVGNSNEYIRSSMSITKSTHQSVIFSPIILESNEWFTVKLLLLCPIDLQVRIDPLGKIAGSKEFKVINEIESTNKPNFFELTFAGGLPTQVARLVSYTICFILIFIAIGIPVSTLSERRDKNKRRVITERFKRNAGMDTNKIFNGILELYIDKGEFVLNRINVYIDFIENSKNGIKIAKDIAEIDEINSQFYPNPTDYIATLLKDANALTLKGETLQIDKYAKLTVKNFMRFLDEMDDRRTT